MNNLIKESLNNAMNVINNNSKFYISSHISPDGDSLGSMLGLALGLIKKGKEVIIVKNDIVPFDYNFLPGVKLIKNLDYIPDNIEVFITLDSSDPDRLGKSKSLLKTSNTVINIDHHISNTNYGDINIVQPNASATGEIIFEFLNEMKIEIDREIAENLYTAISTDTGSFKYDSVSSKTHSIISKLIETGINTSRINIKLYESMSMERTNLFLTSLNTMNTYYNNKMAIVRVTQEMLLKTNTSLEDTEGIVSFIRKIDSIEVACLLKELKSDEIKVSIRSKEYVDVSEVCADFDGGGHIRAAGCTIYSSIDNAESLLVHNLKDKLR